MIPVQDLRPNFQAAYCYTAAEAESLEIRTALMLSVQSYIRKQGWSAEESACVLRQTLPRMQNLMNGEVSRFSVEQLIQFLVTLGLQVQVSVTGSLLDADAIV